MQGKRFYLGAVLWHRQLFAMSLLGNGNLHITYKLTRFECINETANEENYVNISVTLFLHNSNDSMYDETKLIKIHVRHLNIMKILF